MGISLVYSSNIHGDAKAYVKILSPIFVNSKQYCDFQVMFTEIQTKSKDFAQNQNGWFFNDSSKIWVS